MTRTWAKPQPQSTWASVHVSHDGWRIEGLKRSDRGDRDWLVSTPQGRAAGNPGPLGPKPFRTLTAAKAWVDQHATKGTVTR